MQTLHNILIVDDEEDFADNLRTFLQRKGWQVAVAHSGAEAIAAAEHFTPEVVLLDYNLGGMNGLETISALRQRAEPIGCILMSGHLAEDVLPLVHRSGIRHVLSKPFGFGELNTLLGLESEDLRLRAAEAAPPPSSPSAPARRVQPERRSASHLDTFHCLVADGGAQLGERRHGERRLPAKTSTSD